MDFSNVTSQVTNGVAARPEASEPDSASLLATDFSNFLNLLTAQLRAQDPLSPVDSTQFVEQLASFSTVEQQINTNTKLDQIASQLGGGELDTLAQWIGKGVETRAENVNYRGGEVSFRAPDADKYDSVTATVTNAQGEEVHSFSLDKTADTHSWDGTRSDGTRALNGAYTIELRYEGGGRATRTEPASQFDTVREVRLTDDGWRLFLGNDRSIDLDEVTAIVS
ncbi:MAG: hypothetical protein EVA70_02975 [Parvularculaceae bacterium]|nr:MAG: hypothetical protein EVA70_02975 [Parvularculaceae bacterium]